MLKCPLFEGTDDELNKIGSVYFHKVFSSIVYFSAGNWSV